MSDAEISTQLMDRFRKLPVTAIASAVGGSGYPITSMTGVHNRRPGRRLVGRARTVRYVPYRPDIYERTNHDDDAPEYHAMASCGPGDVLVAETGRAIDAAVGGDMVLLHLQMVKAEGLVTDGSVRDLAAILEYGYDVWTGGVTLAGRVGLLVSLEHGGVISCGGMTVCPGDLIVGDDDGITCVPKPVAQRVMESAEHHEALEEKIKQMILDDNVPPGKYYNEATFKKLEAQEAGRKGT